MTAPARIPVPTDPRRRLATPAQHRRLRALAGRFGLSDEERREFTGMFLGTERTSWQRLSAHEANRLIDAFEGFAFLAALIAQRPPR